MKERPILFSGEMIRALLAGTKTQTRRVVKQWQIPKQQEDGTWFAIAQRDPRYGFGVSGTTEQECAKQLAQYGSPYGNPAAKLWVRETCRAEELESGQDGVRYLADNHFRPINDTPSDAFQWMKMNVYGKQGGTNVPSIHMPRWACRLLLEITGVRVERLQDISEADALAEGVKRSQRAVSSSAAVPCFWDYQRNQPDYRDARSSFSSLWESINGAGSWDANPWTWVIEFKKVEA